MTDTAIDHLPTATVVVVPRERFSCSIRSLESILAHTRPDVGLIYVDGGSPEPVATALRSMATQHGFQLLRSEQFLTPNQARNIGWREARTEYVVFVDNDVLAEDGWLDHLLACARKTGAWAVCPLYMEGDPAQPVVHMAGGLARIVEEGGRRRFRERHLFGHRRLQEVRGDIVRGPTELGEFHCLLLRNDLRERLGLLDEGLLGTNEHADLCLGIRDAGGQIWFEPASRITYHTASPFMPEDHGYFLLRWSDDWIGRSLDHFVRKWRLDPEDGATARKLAWCRKHRERLTRTGWRLPSLSQPTLARIKHPIKQLLRRIGWNVGTT